jgi:hypothetical protein
VPLSAAASAGLICALLVATTAFAAASTAAHPTAQDIRATHRYLQLDFRLLQTIAAVGFAVWYFFFAGHLCLSEC